MNENKIPMSAFFGLILVGVGVISLLGSLDYIVSWDIYSTYWPMVIVLLGVRHLFNGGKGIVFGLVIILIGGLLQLEKLDMLYLNGVSISELWIPVLIIVIGLKFMLTGSGKKGHNQEANQTKPAEPSEKKLE